MRPLRQRRKRRFWLIVLAVGLALGAGGLAWYSAPMVSAELEYGRLRELAGAPGGSDGAYGTADSASADDAGDVVGADEAPEQSSSGSVGDLMERDVDWDALRAINPDVIGWIYVPGTPIDYPLCQGPADDPEKYLHTTFEGSVAWPNNEGCPYLDPSADRGLSDEAPLLYGHYQLNQSMFSALSDNWDLDTLQSHDQVYIYTPDGTIHIELFAARIVNASAYEIETSFATADDLNAWLDAQLSASSAVAYDPGDVTQLWTFCTCSYTTWANQRTLTYGVTVEDTRPDARWAGLAIAGEHSDQREEQP